ncbi:MAG TPA: hypothetical protein VMQ65_04200 [Candidatus Limnocylindria bacterium]|nr:hypothetical protein [Candidatus Limnocylindria bacterium]
MIQPRSPAARFAAAGSLGLALVVGLSSAALAARTPTLDYMVSGDTARVSVTGSQRTGVWRIRFVAPSGQRRVDFILRTGDVAWSGVVRVSVREGNSWSLVGRRVLDDALAGGQPIDGCNAGVCWSTEGFRLPRDGDAKFGLTITLNRSGSYRISGAVREASEAFIYGSWVSTGRSTISH